MLTREVADRLIRQFESMSETERDALLERAGVQCLADDIEDLLEEHEKDVCYSPDSPYRFQFDGGLSSDDRFSNWC